MLTSSSLYSTCFPIQVLTVIEECISQSVPVFKVGVVLQLGIFNTLLRSSWLSISKQQLMFAAHSYLITKSSRNKFRRFCYSWLLTLMTRPFSSVLLRHRQVWNKVHFFLVCPSEECHFSARMIRSNAACKNRVQFLTSVNKGWNSSGLGSHSYYPHKNKWTQTWPLNTLHSNSHNFAEKKKKSLMLREIQSAQSVHDWLPACKKPLQVCTSLTLCPPGQRSILQLVIMTSWLAS